MMRELIDILSMLQNIRVLAIKSDPEKITVLLSIYNREVIITITGEGLSHIKYIIARLMSLKK